MIKEKYKIDIAVLCLFFNRPEQFNLVFEQVKKAKPSRLYLYQDGPRSDSDLAGIMECRKIASQVDWECEINTMYQEENLGCDPSEYISQKWAFSHEDKCIVLEDDDVPSVSFFSFCKEMLDRYENDERIQLVSGMNYDEITEYCPYDYFFTSDVAIWGWASWKRVIDKWDGNYSFLDHNYEMEMVRQNLRHKNLRKSLEDLAIQHSKTGKEYYESILIMNQLLNSGLTIVPKYNLVNNIGMMQGGTHFTGTFNTQPKSQIKVALMKVFEIKAPIKHPLYVIEDFSYNLRVNKMFARTSFYLKIKTSMEVFFKRIAYGEFSDVIKSIRRRVVKKNY